MTVVCTVLRYYYQPVIIGLFYICYQFGLHLLSTSYHSKNILKDICIYIVCRSLIPCKVKAITMSGLADKVKEKIKDAKDKVIGTAKEGVSSTKNEQGTEV